MGRPLVAPCAAFAAGAYLTTGRDLELAIALACAVAAVGLVAALRRRSIGVLGFCAALGIVRGSCAGPPARDPALDGALIDPTLDRGGREPVQVEGTVLEAEPRPRGTSFVIRLDRLEPRPGDPVHDTAAHPLVLVLLEHPPPIGRGAYVRRVPPAGSRTPG